MRSMVLVLGVVLLAGVAMGGDWPNFQHDSYNSGIVQGPAPVTGLSQLWATSLYASDGLKFQSGSAPVVHDGTVYAYALTDAVYDASWNLVAQPQARLVALSATNGTVRWISQRLEDEGGWNSHNGASVDPATGDIYVGSWNSMYRISKADGSIVWQHQTPGSWGANAVVNAAPAIGAGKAFWQTGGGAGHLVGIDLNAGTGGATVTPSINIAFPSDVGGSTVGTPVIFSSGTSTYVAMAWGHGFGKPMGGGIAVIDLATSGTVWSRSQTELEAGATSDQQAAYSFNSSMSFKDGILYARSYDDQLGHTTNGTLWAIDALTGSTTSRSGLWQTADRDSSPDVYANAVNGHGAPIVAEGKVFIAGGTDYYGGTGQKVQAFDAATGAWLWDYEGVGGWANQMAYADGYLFAASEDDLFYNPSDGNILTVLSAASGQVVGQFVGAGSSPAIADGYIYSIDTAGRMVAIKGFGPGDADRNGLVDQSDYLAWFQNYGATNADWSKGDFDGNGLVDQSDYLAWFQHYGVSAAGVPEPLTAVLLAVGGLVLVRRRK